MRRKLNMLTLEGFVLLLIGLMAAIHVFVAIVVTWRAWTHCN